ncbi:MAG: hypothetical protein KatS3mg111_2840 [Pirellulaceae bacterium]|nr:MAG: hypothetical protein KatS3mg111_2840 [Pirellulaceae bacterium]
MRMPMLVQLALGLALLSPTSGSAQLANAVAERSWWGEAPPAVGEGRWMRLAMRGNAAAGYLGIRGGQVNLLRVPRGEETLWYVRNLGQDWIRIEYWDSNGIVALTADPTSGLQLAPITADLRQLWSPIGIAGRGWALRSLADSAWLMVLEEGRPRLHRWPCSLPVATWIPSIVVRPPAFQPLLRTIDTRIEPQPPLPPATLHLVNSHRNDLLVLVGDSRRPLQVQELVIASGEVIDIQVERPAGATLTEIIEVWSPGGIWQRQTITMPVQAAYALDYSVYEKHLQSIAIDATGKSPHPIEDVNYVPKSVGWFSMTIDASVPDGVRVDLYRQARDADNPGAVRRLGRKTMQREEEGLSPTEEVLERFQPSRRGKF